MKRLTKPLLFVATVAAMLSISGAASAKTFDFSDTFLTEELNTTSFKAGVLNDTYKFSIGETSDFTASIASTLQNNAELTNLQVVMNPAVLSPTVYGGQRSYLGVLSAGYYLLNVTATAIKPGSYSVYLFASPVPEPESLTMLLGGLLLVGSVAGQRRRMKK